MTRSNYFLLSFLCAAVVVGALTVKANPGGGGDAEPSIENTLAVQKAMLQARDCLFGVNPEPKKAVDVLETNLPRINGDRKYLALLRDAYRSYVKVLALSNQPAQLDLYQQRLKILEGNETIQQITSMPPTFAPKQADQSPGPQQTAFKAEPVVNAVPAAATLRTKTDPFESANELKLEASGYSPKANPGKDLLAKADDDFKQKRYASAKHLYEQANLADAKILGEDGRKCWAYCQLQLIVEQVNRFPEQNCDWTKLESDVKYAVAVAPVLAKTGEDILGDMAKRKSAGPAAVARGSMNVPVKHMPRDAKGWLVAETVNFRVHHNLSQDLAESVIQTAEATRLSMSRKWFGKESEAWSPKCDIYLHANATDYSQCTGQNSASPGHSKIDRDRVTGRVVFREIHLRGDNATMIEAVLPHETTHVVLAGNFGNHDVPRWVDEGIAVLTEPAEKVQQHRKNLARSMESLELIPLRNLLQMDDYPPASRIGTFYAQSVTLVEFLTKEKGPVVLTQFVRDSLREGYEPALRTHYGYTSIIELQDRFTERMLTENRGAQPAFAGQR